VGIREDTCQVGWAQARGASTARPHAGRRRQSVRDGGGHVGSMKSPAVHRSDPVPVCVSLLANFSVRLFLATIRTTESGTPDGISASTPSVTVTCDPTSPSAQSPRRRCGPRRARRAWDRNHARRAVVLFGGGDASRRMAVSGAVSIEPCAHAGGAHERRFAFAPTNQSAARLPACGPSERGSRDRRGLAASAE
jgi:hypothetical protein